ncbi:protein phosphatase 2C domain-containing protein [Nocardioides sp.]|uniref:PP2C family protein-serine/threonine phosphatase n=1 Tax=Nocardioides sp. TaxID=35761 RepID=UPI002607295D|nr:protein phosphatase 2C domain-containing protein [Nocardioides sp.]
MALSTAVDVTTTRWSPRDVAPSAATTVLSCAGATHAGAVRSVNEDSFLVGPPVFVVADGIGGHACGDIASALVVEAFAPLSGDACATAADVEAALARARVTVAGIDGAGPAEPGATMVSASYLVEGERAYWLISHVGDSRAYSWTGSAVEQITHDHSVVQELIDSGELSAEAAATHPDRHVITRAIGAAGNTAAEFSLLPVESKQRLLLCSDGLTSEVSDRAISMILSNAASAEQAVSDLVDAAVNMGGRDNVTVVVIDVLGLGPFAALREDTIPLQRKPR